MREIRTPNIEKMKLSGVLHLMEFLNILSDAKTHAIDFRPLKKTSSTKIRM